MSTRANIIVESKNCNDRLIFYKHSDGYPEGVKDILNKFIDLMYRGQIRNNVEQGSCWLIILGAIDYQTIDPDLFSQHDYPLYNHDDDEKQEKLLSFIPKDWKVGSIEPSTSIHGDIEHLYVVDMDNIKWFEASESQIRQYEAYLNEPNT